MFADLSDEIRECYERAAHCVQEAAAQTDPTLKRSLLGIGRRWLAMARRERAAAGLWERRWRVTLSLQIDDGLLATSHLVTP
jgi:hypothetical protein